MIPIIGTFLQSKKSTTTPIPRPCFDYTFFNGSGATKVADGQKCDGTVFAVILPLGISTGACLFEGTEQSTPPGLTITKGSAC
jgi:hypothetical protein